ncbi:TPA: hypothetical protein GDO54_018448 [Pyxicephalus adspersus]|uniref:Uncharacterized protein n=1 Tax=Pyxicephalus adspersus TaxID=30357 RepID=A0AAV2ZI76_PYXAD|nr:TPA: hypothetical protein GDO54_018448 [Pyxicephalus adspersus]
MQIQSSDFTAYMPAWALLKPGTNGPVAQVNNGSHIISHAGLSSEVTETQFIFPNTKANEQNINDINRAPLIKGDQKTNRPLTRIK